MQLVSSITHKLFKILIDNYICKLISIVLAITLFTSVSSIGESGYAFADIFCGYERCQNPIRTPKEELKFSQECKKDQDYEIISPPPQEQESDVAVLSIHGGEIELNTSRITSDLSSRNKWDRYDFNGKINNEKCLKLEELSKSNNSNKNFVVLHITSTHFDEKKAVDLVSSHENAVSIHGFSREEEEEEEKIQTICVGGQNEDKVKKFIEHVNKESYKLKEDKLNYSLNLVNAPLEKSNFDKGRPVSQRNTICLEKKVPKQSALTGTDWENIVNKSRNPNGGLQIELNRQIRIDLAQGRDKPNSSSPNEYQLLRDVIYGAIKEAMND
jgi:phage replication-related protein YjqB (UPF0714/DUF867 family)